MKWNEISLKEKEKKNESFYVYSIFSIWADFLKYRKTKKKRIEKHWTLLYVHTSVFVKAKTKSLFGLNWSFFFFFFFFVWIFSGEIMRHEFKTLKCWYHLVENHSSIGSHSSLILIRISTVISVLCKVTNKKKKSKYFKLKGDTKKKERKLKRNCYFSEF